MAELESTSDLAGEHVRPAAETPAAEDHRKLLTDLKEERDVGAQNSWVAEPVVKIIGELEASLRKYPPIKVGTPDP